MMGTFETGFLMGFICGAILMWIVVLVMLSRWRR